MTRSIVIIGGGVIGCAVAFRLAQKGLAPLVLERSAPGAEASTAAAGMLAPQEEAEEPGLSLELGLASRARYPALARELHALTGVDIGWQPSGLLAVATPSAAEALRERARWQRKRGLAVEELGPAEARRLEPALGDFALALRFPDEAQVDPPRLVKALQLAAMRAGAEFRTAYVQRVLHDGARVRGVQVDGGQEIEAPQVVLAAGAWSSLIEGTPLPPATVQPVRGQIVELETRPALLSHLVFVHGEARGYVVTRPDGRVLVGSTMEQVGFRKEATAAGVGSLCELARRVSPSLGEAPVRGYWANFRPGTEDKLPILGATAIEGLFMATGHFRNGILLAPITADAIAAVVTGEAPPIDLVPYAAARFAAR